MTPELSAECISRKRIPGTPYRRLTKRSALDAALKRTDPEKFLRVGELTTVYDWLDQPISGDIGNPQGEKILARLEGRALVVSVDQQKFDPFKRRTLVFELNRGEFNVGEGSTFRKATEADLAVLGHVRSAVEQRMQQVHENERVASAGISALFAVNKLLQAVYTTLYGTPDLQQLHDPEFRSKWFGYLFDSAYIQSDIFLRDHPDLDETVKGLKFTSSPDHILTANVGEEILKVNIKGSKKADEMERDQIVADASITDSRYDRNDQLLLTSGALFPHIRSVKEVLPAELVVEYTDAQGKQTVYTITPTFFRYISGWRIYGAENTPADQAFSSNVVRVTGSGTALEDFDRLTQAAESVRKHTGNVKAINDLLKQQYKQERIGEDRACRARQAQAEVALRERILKDNSTGIEGARKKIGEYEKAVQALEEARKRLEAI